MLTGFEFSNVDIPLIFNAIYTLFILCLLCAFLAFRLLDAEPFFVCCLHILQKT